MSTIVRVRLLRRPPVEIRDALRALGPGSVAIDCGAHVGNLTAWMAATGARVYAFEPNPHAFADLERRFAGDANVTCLEAAVSDHEGVGRLYLHRDAGEDPVVWATASSLFASKGNVDEDTFVDVDVVDLPRFVESVGPVTVLKLDVEGAEVAILDRMLGLGQLDEIPHVLVEMHDRKIPELDAGELRRRLGDYENVRLDWR